MSFFIFDYSERIVNENPVFKNLVNNTLFIVNARNFCIQYFNLRQLDLTDVDDTSSHRLQHLLTGILSSTR